MAKKKAKPTRKAESKNQLTGEETMAAVLSYLHFLVLVPLFAIQKKNDFIKFHVKQGLILFFAEIIILIILLILKSLPVFGWFFVWVDYLISLCFLILIIYCIVQALQGKQWKIPIVSNYTNLVHV
ncbi:hypothetical protein C4573_02115 [Candidatus Woesearchaeota archaeon]|nr:MAG: hypothetical protein C4573_02115 [Candidatus Woesearchaeota archaeon]